MWTLRDKYAIAGVGFTDYSRDSGTTVLNLATEACLNAVADAGLRPADVDGLVSFEFNDSVPGISVATAMGIPAARYAIDYAGGGNLANLIILSAAAAIEAAETAEKKARCTMRRPPADRRSAGNAMCITSKQMFSPSRSQSRKRTSCAQPVAS